MSMVAIPHRKEPEKDKERGDKDKDRTRERNGYHNPGTSTRKPVNNGSNGHNRGYVNKSGTKRVSVQDRLSRHRNGH